MKELMRAIEALVDERLAVTEEELNAEFVFTENMKEISDVKAACIMLAEKGNVMLMTDKLGGVVVVKNNVYSH